MYNRCIFLVLFLLFSLGASAESPAIVSSKPIKDSIYMMVERLPEFPGGEDSLMQFIRKNLVYPNSAYQTGKQGRVIVRFVVTSEGTIAEPTIIRGFDSDCEKEALRVLQLMPRWKPGYQNGHPVNAYFVLPIVYRISPPRQSPDSTGRSTDPLLVIDNKVRPYSDLQSISRDDIKQISVLKDSAAVKLWGDKGLNGVVLVTLKGQKAAKPDSIKAGATRTSVEIMPEYPGGTTALIQFISKNLKYPSGAQNTRTQGRVVIRFVVDEEGNVCEPHVLRSLNADCDAEAIRVIKLMPKWAPGTQDGKPVPVYYTIPIVYRLKQ